jgi:DNA polymerase-3 subunit chi
MNAEFYILQFSDEERVLTFACQLIEKIYNGKETIYIHLDNESQATKLDTLLWTFDDGSFLPHALANDMSTSAPITIGFAETPIRKADKYINISKKTIPHTCKPLCEVVLANSEAQVAARERYRHYREQGYNIHTHKISSSSVTLDSTDLLTVANKF